MVLGSHRRGGLGDYMTSVKVSKLIKRERSRGWRMPPNTVYIGRPTKWENPYPVTGDFSAAQSVKRYRGYALLSIRYGGLDLSELKGKDLACWCRDWTPGEPPIDCHGVVLLELMEDMN